MSFGNLKTEMGLAKLNDHLFNKSYIEGYVPTQSDVEIFKSIAEIKSQYMHANRWYNHIKSFSEEEKKAFPGVKEAPKDDDDEVDLFGSDDEDEEAEKLKKERVAAYEAKKSKKPTVVAKSIIVLNVKPWDDETDMKEMERLVRTIEADGLVWGTSKLVPLAYGVFTLNINVVVEDDKIGTDFLEEKICAFEDYVQSVDTLAFNKI